jgi:hypothetical protein
MRTIRQNDFLELLSKCEIEIINGSDVWDVDNNVFLGTITDSTFETLYEEEIITYDVDANVFTASIKKYK